MKPARAVYIVIIPQSVRPVKRFPPDGAEPASGGSGVSSEPDAEKGFPAAAAVIIIVLAAGAAAALVILKVKHKI